MHRIKIDNIDLRTDLLNDQLNHKKTISNEEIIGDIKIVSSYLDEYKYTTIYYKDITDTDSFYKVEKVLIKELKKYINPSRKDTTLIIGLGNNNSTPDSLGPKVINNILVTRYLFLLGDVENGYSNVCSFIPNVTGNTGIETASIIKNLISSLEPIQVIVIDSLKTNNKDRLNKTIQITNSGIHPGSGIGNNREEISKLNMNCNIIAIGVPTVVELDSKKDNLIVCTADIDFMVDKLAILIANSINKILHKNLIRQNN